MSCCLGPDDGADRPTTFIVADWTPLDALSQTFAEFGAEATSALAFQAVSAAFAALAFEVSAHQHYTLAYHGLWGHVPSTILQGLEQSRTDLQEATSQWGTVALWFEKLGAQEPAQRDLLRSTFGPLIQEHQQHLWTLQTRLRQEHESIHTRLPIVVAVPSNQREGGHS